MTAKTLALFAAAVLSAVAGAQSWNRAYDEGLASARAGKWAAARESFQQAAAGRPDDRSGPTVLPGPATERKLWRNGAPYSPNFLAAYSLYRQALGVADATESANSMRTAAGELETLVAKDQASPEAFFYLDVIYARLGDEAKRRGLAERLTKLGHTPDFKVDGEILAPEEVAALQARTAGVQTSVPTPNSPNAPKIVGPGPLKGNGVTPPVIANVAPLGEKFALVIGQNNSRLSGGLIPFAGTDAERVRAALVDFAGYPTDNVTLIQNASGAEMKAAAAALAGRLPEGGIVTIYYAGAGVNLDGKDYLAGADTESGGDVASMLSKSDLFSPFVQRGARVFAFFETNRPIDANGLYFGREAVNIGAVSQVQSTRPGDFVSPTFRENQSIGVFTNAFVRSLAEIRSNRIPIFEFTWQMFNIMRRGDSGTTGGGGRQVCTLPQLSNLAADSKF